MNKFKKKNLKSIFLLVFVVISVFAAEIENQIFQKASSIVTSLEKSKDKSVNTFHKNQCFVSYFISK